MPARAEYRDFNGGNFVELVLDVAQRAFNPSDNIFAPWQRPSRANNFLSRDRFSQLANEMPSSCRLVIRLGPGSF